MPRSWLHPRMQRCGHAEHTQELVCHSLRWHGGAPDRTCICPASLAPSGRPVCTAHTLRSSSLPAKSSAHSGTAPGGTIKSAVAGGGLAASGGGGLAAHGGGGLAASGGGGLAVAGDGGLLVGGGGLPVGGGGLLVGGGGLLAGGGGLLAGGGTDGGGLLDGGGDASGRAAGGGSGMPVTPLPLALLLPLLLLFFRPCVTPTATAVLPATTSTAQATASHTLARLLSPCCCGGAC